LREQARNEQRHLERYQVLSRYSLAELRGGLEKGIDWVHSLTSPYSRLMQGGQDRFRRIVRISGSNQEDALVDLPYPMQIQGQAGQRNGWYWMEGVRRLDIRNLDKEGLPMVQVTLDEQGKLQPCQEKGCLDLLTPLSILRLETNNPEWSVESTRSIIDGADTL